MDFNGYLVGGVPLVLVVWGLVTFCKSLGVAGRALQIVGLLIGLALGVAYQVAQATPTDFAGWFTALIFGAALGLTANGLWDVAKFDLLPRVGHGSALSAGCQGNPKIESPDPDAFGKFIVAGALSGVGVSLPRRGCFD